MRMAASTAIGMAPASGAATSRITSSVSECTMPATGVFAPDRMLVAVRAIAPVAGRPPTIGDTMLATPCATSSMFESWRSPLILSATIADIRDSMAPSRPTVMAGISSVGISDTRNAGMATCGRPLGMPPNRDADGFHVQPQQWAPQRAGAQGDDRPRQHAASTARCPR